LSSSFDLSRNKHDTTVLATPPPCVTNGENPMRERNEEVNTEQRRPSNISVLEEGREWYGYRDEGIRRASVALGVVGPWVRPGFVEGRVDGGEDKDKDTEGKKDAKAFWHRNGRKLEGCVIPVDDSTCEDSERGNVRSGKEESKERKEKKRRVGIRGMK
jgi:hypothetical protein